MICKQTDLVDSLCMPADVDQVAVCCAGLQAVRAMRFDPAAHKPKDKLPTERTMTDAEVAKAIEEAESDEP